MLLSRTSGAFDVAYDDYRLTPDGRTLIYRIGDSFRGDHSAAFYHVPVDGSRHPVRITREPGVWSFDVSPDGGRVLFRGDLDTFDVAELYTGRIAAGPRAARR